MAALIRSWSKVAGYGLECFSYIAKGRFDPLLITRHGSTAPSPENFLELKKRGLFEHVFPDTTDRMPQLMELLSSPQSLYCGFDPTADSLHIGNLITLIALLHGQRAGHNPIAVIGGATALIGDPSGKAKDRVPMKAEDVENNVIAIMENVERIVNNHKEFIYKGQDCLPQFRILNNGDWYKSVDVITFLTTTGRHFRLGEMISRHSVQSRLQSKEGISCTEFLYQMFQAADWLHLFQQHNCSIQVGGSDQMGNIVSGFDLVHKVTKKYVFGLLMPLILSSSGEKLGKSTGNSLWLDPNKTSPYELYQYFLNVADSEVERLLKLFTFLPLEEIDALMEKQNESPEKRYGQKKLAEQITLLAHGEDGIHSALRCTEVFFGDSLAALSAMSAIDLQQLFKNAPTAEIIYDQGMSVQDLCRKINCFSRDVDAERIIKAGGVYINQLRVTEPNHVLREGEDILPNKITLVRVGKKNYHVVKWFS